MNVLEKVAIDSRRGLTTTSTTMELTLIRTATAALLAGLLALPSAPALAAPDPIDPTDEAEAPEPPDPARVAFEQGLNAYDDGDYALAARRWTEAYELMAQTPERSAGRRVLGFDLAQAQMRAHAQDGDPARLDAAKPLLEAYVAWVDRPAHTMDEGEKQDRQRAVELLAKIEQETAPPPVPPPAISPPTPEPPPPPLAEPKPRGTGLLIGGGVALAAGIGSIVGAAAAVSAGGDAEDAYNLASETGDSDGVDAANRDGRRANAGFIAASASAVAFTAAGVTMLTIGGLRRKRYVSASASVTPSSAGASVSVRF